MSNPSRASPNDQTPSDQLAEMTRELLQFRDEREWKQFHNPKDQALSLVLEAAELLELFQWKNGEELEQHLRERREDLADELADVLGWLLLIAADREISLPEAFRRKLSKNRAKYPVDAVKGSARKYTEYKSNGEN
jgi:NTP pyrophosphatase (non-canonical NTP hydrolase)